MANAETKQLDSIISSRRALLAVGGAALASLAFAPKAEAATTDADILNFALNLEYLEAQYYNLAVHGVTIDNLSTPIPVAVNGGTAGTVTVKPNFAAVPFTNTAIQAYATETALEEAKHVSFLQNALGTSAVSMPNIDLYNSFNTLAVAAGVAASFDPFSGDVYFLLGAYIFEDVGVTAYHGAAGLITNKAAYLPAAAGIMAVEAYHAGLVRTSIAQLDGSGNALKALTQKISATRSMLANPTTGTTSAAVTDDVGVSLTTVALEDATTNTTTGTHPATTIVDADVNSVAYSRTTTQVLRIVTGGTQSSAGVYQGVFFPNGLNGNIK